METLFRNILNNGSILASPSKEPDYNFHWTRDSAIVIKALIRAYLVDKKQSYLEYFNKYIDISLQHIKYNAGEPKFHIDGKPYTKEWGRPQNDGPALRGLVCLELLDILKNRTIDLMKIINNDLNYTIQVIEEPCFDLWEELNGYHFYTRILQYKFLYTINLKKLNNLIYIPKNILELSKKRFFDHFDNNTLYSSFSIDGKILRKYDSSVLLGLEHVDYVIPNLGASDFRIQNYVKDLISIFNKEYKINKKLNIYFLGRYQNDKYFNGNPWIITSISLYHYYLVINNFNLVSKSFKNFIKFIKNKKYLSEQIDKNDATDKSVEKLTWNYAELILLFNKIKNLNIEQYFDLVLN